MKEIYLAGGCFWAMEKLMGSLPGVHIAESGYANGKKEIVPNYNKVCGGETGYRETVKVTYNPQQVALETLLFAYFYVVDTTVENRQGNDIGSQYQTGIYYVDDDSKQIVEQAVSDQMLKGNQFKVEMGPLVSYYRAEEYHQGYLKNNPYGYCHISSAEMNEVIEKVNERQANDLKKYIGDRTYYKLSDQMLRERLTDEEYEVTQNSMTEAPYSNKYWRNSKRGLYVDVTTGEPLFASKDKYESSCGWPAFSKVIKDDAIKQKCDTSHNMNRTEVRSSIGDSHLGHIFTGDAESPSSVRYCINSASLRFIPYDEMEKEGYGNLKHYI